MAKTTHESTDVDFSSLCDETVADLMQPKAGVRRGPSDTTSGRCVLIDSLPRDQKARERLDFFEGDRNGR